MAFLQPLHVPRTKISHLMRIPYDSDYAFLEYFPVGEAFLGRQTVPPSNVWRDGKTHSFMAPRSHYHLLQTESFTVEAGSGNWYLAGQKYKLHAGERIQIPRWQAHRFENASDTDELRILWRYDPPDCDMERRFFSNTLMYMDDCRKVGVEPSILQLSVFLTAAWMPFDVIWVPGGEWFRCLVNMMLMWWMAAVGWIVFGYRASYIEYYDARLWQQGEQKKGK